MRDIARSMTLINDIDISYTSRMMILDMITLSLFLERSKQGNSLVACLSAQEWQSLPLILNLYFVRCPVLIYRGAHEIPPVKIM